MDRKSGSTMARTSGDGMENVDTVRGDVKTNIYTTDTKPSSSSHSTLSIPGAFSIYRTTEDANASIKLPSKSPEGKKFYLVPHLVTNKKSFSLKNKEPKFVPFEPYKAAVS